CEAPVTEMFLHNLQEILVPHLCKYDRRLHQTSILASADGSILHSGQAVGTGMSCGVDSFYTASLYYKHKLERMRLTHLYCGNYLYGNESLVYGRARQAAKDMGFR